MHQSPSNILTVVHVAHVTERHHNAPKIFLKIKAKSKQEFDLIVIPDLAAVGRNIFFFRELTYNSLKIDCVDFPTIFC